VPDYTAAVTATTGIALARIISILRRAVCYAARQASLAEMAALANIPVKIGGVDGSQVEAYVAAGRLTEVAIIA